VTDLLEREAVATAPHVRDSVTLPDHREVASSSERGSIARKRFQRGHVYLDGDKWKGRYRGDVITGQGAQRVWREVILGTKRELPTKRLAERRMEGALARINGLDYRPGRVATFEEFLERWKAEILTKQKPSSPRAVRSHLRCYIVPQLGKLRLDQLGTENQQAFITRISEKGISRKTVLNVLGTLSCIVSTARNWGYNCEQITLDKLHLPPRGARHEARHFTVEHLRGILAIAEEPWRTLFCILTLDGLRAGEVLGLQWQDIDLKRQLLHIRRSAWNGRIQTAKSQTSETVLPIPDALATILKEYRSHWQANPQGLRQCGYESFVRFRLLGQAQELHTLWHDRRWRFITGCEHDGLVERTVHKQTCQRFPPLLIQQVRPIDHNKAQPRYHRQSTMECHPKSKLI
jgi:integrase